MKLRKIEWYEIPDFLRKDPRVASLQKEVKKLKAKKPDFVGGVGATGTYHRVEIAEIFFSKTSFNPGINVIGVASGVPTTIWLPKDLEHNHLIAVKDELGIADQQPITIRVKTS